MLSMGSSEASTASSRVGGLGGGLLLVPSLRPGELASPCNGGSAAPVPTSSFVHLPALTLKTNLAPPSLQGCEPRPSLNTSASA
jgi:hypothetical protein